MPFANLFSDDFKTVFITNLNALKDFNFTISNPVFWLFVFVLFVILIKMWDIRKAFSFSALVVMILVFSTEIEKYLGGVFNQPGEFFDPLLIRFIAMALISILALLYFFMMR